MGFLGTLLGGAAGFMIGGPAGAMMGASLGGGIDASQAASSAASTQADAATNAAALQKQTADQQVAWQREQFDRQTALQEPWRQAGMQSLNRLSAGLQSGGEFGSPQQFQFGAAEFNANQDPGYAFRMSEGMKALDRTAAARGGLLSGSAMKGAQRFGQELGSQEYQNAFNRALTGFNANQQSNNNLFNRLSGVAGTGQTSAQQIGDAGQNMTSGMGSAMGNYANQAGDAFQNAAQARASGYVGSQNALGNALSQGINYYGQQQAMSRMFPQQAAPMDWASPQQSYPAQSIDPFANIG